MPSKTYSTTIFFHNYYGEHEEWIQFFCERMNTPFTLFYNIVRDSIHNLQDPTGLRQRLYKAASGSHLQDIVLRRSPNQGKDIGGKMVLLDAFIREGLISDYSLFLHDKKSPYKIQNREWKEKLFRIAEPDFIEQAMAAFTNDDKVGIIAGAESISNELDPGNQTFRSNNHIQLIEIMKNLDIATADHRYVAGTMFWARTPALVDFFRKHPPLEIRKTLEFGNIMDESRGSQTHAWERILTWLIFAQGYKMRTL